MIGRNRTLASTIFLIFLVFYPHIAHAETLKSSEFLKWGREAQEYYFRTSIGMVTFIAVENDKKQATCIDDWYFGNQKIATEYILKLMKKFTDYHPRGVIMAILEKKCGKFDYVNRKRK